jgi:hypothetical protein
MILPAKHLPRDRALLQLGAEVLSQLEEKHTVSELWHRVRLARATQPSASPISFDWFVLSLSFLYSIAAIDLSDGLLTSRR